MVKGKILINQANIDKIEELLRSEQGKAYVRCFNATDIITLADEAEARLNTLGVAKKYRTGTIVHYSEYASNRAKKWSEDITEVKLKRDRNHWYIIEVSRTSRSWEGRINHLYLSEEAIHYLCEQLRQLKLES